MSKTIEGAQPYFFKQQNDITKKIKHILASGKLSQGENVKMFEEKTSKMFNSKYAIAVNSGGTAIEICLEAFCIKGKEVLVPTQTFIATANAVVRAGGTPVFCDVDPKTGCIDIEDVQKKINKKTAGVIFVYMFGIVPNSVIKLKRICKKKSIFLLEDAAHAHGGSIGNYKVGSIGDAACFSFYATKILTCGEGGLITTSNPNLKKKCSSIMNHGKNPHSPLFIYSGNNFRLTEMQAIIALSQLKYLKKNLLHRNKIAKIYQKYLNNSLFYENIVFNKNSKNTFWRYPLYLSKYISRSILQKLCADKHNFRITWMYEPLCHQQPVFKKNIKLPNAEKIIKKLINLPTHLLVKPADAVKICKNLNLECKKLYGKKKNF
jgi:dTDP-4-amino-4,6-dideoxygalactose transaminase